jgi:hypothetical protein
MIEMKKRGDVKKTIIKTSHNTHQKRIKEIEWRMM